jgi:hypothetical protein
MKLPKFLIRRLLAVADRRPPDQIIGSGDNTYLLRWYLIPHNHRMNIYLHKFVRSDDDRALHTHPWNFNISVLLRGAYDEVTAAGVQRLDEGQIKVRIGEAPHRVRLCPTVGSTVDGFVTAVERPAWTLFITGPKVREWGFLCPQGWRHWKDFTRSTGAGNEVGRGCE